MCPCGCLLAIKNNFMNQRFVISFLVFLLSFSSPFMYVRAEEGVGTSNTDSSITSSASTTSTTTKPSLRPAAAEVRTKALEHKVEMMDTLQEKRDALKQQIDIRRDTLNSS